MSVIMHTNSESPIGTARGLYVSLILFAAARGAVVDSIYSSAFPGWKSVLSSTSLKMGYEYLRYFC
jgi:hypothetical protein